MATTTTIWVVQCLNPDSKYYQMFYFGSGLSEHLQSAHFYGWDTGAKKSARKRNQDYNGAGHFQTQGWTAVSCTLTLDNIKD